MKYDVARRVRELWTEKVVNFVIFYVIIKAGTIKTVFLLYRETPSLIIELSALFLFVLQKYSFHEGNQKRE